MSAFIRKDNSKSLLDEDSSISDVITEAFDNVCLLYTSPSPRD